MGWQDSEPCSHLRRLAEILLGDSPPSVWTDVIDDDRAAANIHEDREGTAAQIGHASTAPIIRCQSIRCALPKRRVHDGAARHAESGAVVTDIAIARAATTGLGVFR